MKRYAYLLLYWIVLSAVIAFLSGFVKQRSVRPDASANGSQVFPSCCHLATRAGLGTIGRESDIARFV